MTSIRRLQDWITLQAETRPHAPAVIAGEDRVPYGQLERLSNQLARLLKDAGCERHDRVALLMPKSAIAVIAMLAVYKADCVLVTLDPASGLLNLGRIIEACACRYLLAAGSVVDLLDRLFDQREDVRTLPVGWVGAGAPAARHFAARFVFTDVLSYADTPVAAANTDDDPAHVFFTSPTMRRPKGIITTHKSVIAFVEWALRYFGMSTADRVSGHAPLHSGLAVFDAFGAFAAGGELHLVPPELNLLPHALAEFIRRSELTQWLSASTVLHRLGRFDAVAPGDFPALKRLLWCGEVLPTPTLVRLMQRLPHATFTRLYGPAETTIASSYCTVRQCLRDPVDDIPIGTACDGEHLLVLNEQLEPTAPGEIGPALGLRAPDLVSRG